MKKALTFLGITVTLISNAQSPVTANPNTAVTLPSSACLGCAGSLWSNEQAVFALNGVGADVGLMQGGFCFQSTCCVSRYLEATNFGFSIPLIATIDTINVTIHHSATALNAIRDSIVQLEPDQSTGPVGINKAAANTWPTSFAPQVYNSSTGALWGYAWTPALVDNSQFGVLLKVRNTDAAQQTASVDYISMTIYYSTPTGSYSVTASPQQLSVSNAGSAFPVVHFSLGKASTTVMRIMNMAGQVVLENDLGMLNEGAHQFELSDCCLPSGFYIVDVQTPGEHFAAKFVRLQQ